MTKCRLSQSEVNQICLEVKRQGEEVTISKVKSLLGKGTHSDIAPKVLFFKQDEAGALKTNDTHTDQQADTDQNCFTDLSSRIQHILSTYLDVQIEQCTLEIRQVIESYLKSKQQGFSVTGITQLTTHQDHEDLKQHIELLQEQNQALTNKLAKLQQKLDNIQSQQASHQIKQNQQEHYNNQQRLEASITEQLKQLKGPRRAAFSERQVCIYLSITDFSTTLIKELKKNKQGKHQAKATYNYKTKFWELTNFNMTTLQFLFTNGFDISEHLVQYATKLKRQQRRTQHTDWSE